MILIDETLESGSYEYFPEGMTRVYLYVKCCPYAFTGLLKEGRARRRYQLFRRYRVIVGLDAPPSGPTQPAALFIFLPRPSGTTSIASLAAMNFLSNDYSHAARSPILFQQKQRSRFSSSIFIFMFLSLT